MEILSVRRINVTELSDADFAGHVEGLRNSELLGCEVHDEINPACAECSRLAREHFEALAGREARIAVWEAMRALKREGYNLASAGGA